MMTSRGATLTCKSCHKSWKMDVYGRLESSDEITESPHIPDWYEFQREEVEKQIEGGKYSLKMEAAIEALPNENNSSYIEMWKNIAYNIKYTTIHS